MINGYAVDLGGTKTAVAHIVDNVVVDRLQIATQGNASVSTQVDVMKQLLQKLGYKHGERLGVAVAGRVDHLGRWSAVNSQTLSQVTGASLLDQLRAQFGDNVTVINDAAAAALAEAKIGAGKGADNFAYLTVSTGVGGGVILNGRAVKSKNGLAGHLGFVSSPLGSTLCGSGRHGTVESTASGKAIALAAGTEDAKLAFEAGTELASLAIDRSAAAIAKLCVDLNSIFGLDLIGIGGSVGLAQGYLARVVSYLDLEPELFRVDIIPAALGQDSALLGALIDEEDTK